MNFMTYLLPHAVAGYKWFLVKQCKILRGLHGKGVLNDEGDAESYDPGDLFAADPWEDGAVGADSLIFLILISFIY